MVLETAVRLVHIAQNRSDMMQVIINHCYKKSIEVERLSRKNEDHTTKEELELAIHQLVDIVEVIKTTADSCLDSPFQFE